MTRPTTLATTPDRARALRDIIDASGLIDTGIQTEAKPSGTAMNPVVVEFDLSDLSADNSQQFNAEILKRVGDKWQSTKQTVKVRDIARIERDSVSAPGHRARAIAIPCGPAGFLIDTSETVEFVLGEALAAATNSLDGWTTARAFLYRRDETFGAVYWRQQVIVNTFTGVTGDLGQYGTAKYIGGRWQAQTLDCEPLTGWTAPETLSIDADPGPGDA